MNFYTNSIAKSRRKRKGLQALAFILRSDLNLILLILKTSDLEKRALVLWDAEERLGYPTLRVRAAIMSRTTRDVFEPTNLQPKTLKLHKFKMRANYLVCMKTLKEATSYSVQACLYLVRCSSQEIRAQWPKHKQDKHGVWKDGILYSKNRWCDLLELDGVEPFTSVRLREQVPVIRQTACLFIALAIQIHWTVSGRQIMYRPAMVKHRVANFDRLISMRYTVTCNSEKIFRRIKRSCIPCRNKATKR